MIDTGRIPCNTLFTIVFFHLLHATGPFRISRYPIPVVPKLKQAIFYSNPTKTNEFIFMRAFIDKMWTITEVTRALLAVSM
jgi:hypothetical protein